jgi:hypothetical protein
MGSYVTKRKVFDSKKLKGKPASTLTTLHLISKSLGEMFEVGFGHTYDEKSPLGLNGWIGASGFFLIQCTYILLQS